MSVCDLQAFYKMFSPGEMSRPLYVKKDIKFLSSTKGIMTAKAVKDYVCVAIIV